MENEPQPDIPQNPPPSQSASSWRIWQWMGAGFLTLAGVVLGFVLLRGTAQNGLAQNQNTPTERPGVQLFAGWNNPDLVIVLSGQMIGYLQPCGCSEPQKGGMARRYNLVQYLKAKNWPVTAIDLGDIAPPPGPQQHLKYIYAMKALKLMGYQAIGLGKNEFNMPLIDALADYSLNDPQPCPLVTNLEDTAPGQLFHKLNVRQGTLFTAGKFTVGVLGGIHTKKDKVTGAITADHVMAQKDAAANAIKFLAKEDVLPKTLAVLKQNKVDLSVLLYQGYEKEAHITAADLHEERVKNAAIAPVDILFCLTEDEEPPAVLQKNPQAPNTSIVTMGHKGRYIGVIGLWKNAGGFETKYQLVSMGPEWQTKPGQQGANPVMVLMEKYTQEVRDGNFLAKFPRGPHETQVAIKGASYVGSNRCASCHPHADQVWAITKHAQAFNSLVNKAKDPGLRQFDGECLVCHTVGFKYLTGYNDPPGNVKHNAKLLQVGCESCHGPGSAHSNAPQNVDLYPLINPFRATEKELNPKTPANEKQQMLKNRMRRLDDFCQKCHDDENDVHWSFDKYWPQIVHPTPKAGVKAAQGKAAVGPP